MTTPPLAGIRVLEVANWLAGPSCAAILSDLGADVVKVEPPQGDAYRQLQMTAAGFEFEFELNPGFELDNRGKRSISLDLTTAGGQDVLRKLAGQVDIVVTNLVPERREKYGLSVEAVREMNPTAIYASVTGYGSQGPDADRPGWDHTSYWARSGIMGLMGARDSAPTSCRGGMGDHPTGLNLLAAILVALRLRDQTGEGQFVDVALQQTGMWSLGLDVQSALMSNEVPSKKIREESQNPMANTYLCRDGRWVLMVMPTPDYWPRFCRALGCEDWLSDEGLQTPQDRAVRSQELTAAVDERMATRDYAAWAKRFDAEKLVYALVPQITEVIKDPQPRAMGVFTTVDHPQLGKFETLDTPFNIEGADIGVRGPAPAVGEHTSSVLDDAGLAADEIAELAAGGAFG